MSPNTSTYSDSNVQKTLLLNFRNNVIYGSNLGHTGKDPARINYVGNYIRNGLDKNHMFRIGSFMTWMHAHGNTIEGLPGDDQWRLIAGAIQHNKSNEPFPVEPVTTQSPAEAYEKILDSCGATLPKRDAVDVRIVQQVRNGTGKLINSQEEVGGWPNLRSIPAPQDSDEDGMPDAWETKHGFDPQSSSDAPKDKDQDGYTNVEEWLNNTNPQQKD